MKTLEDIIKYAEDVSKIDPLAGEPRYQVATWIMQGRVAAMKDLLRFIHGEADASDTP